MHLLQRVRRHGGPLPLWLWLDLGQNARSCMLNGSLSLVLRLRPPPSRPRRAALSNTQSWRPRGAWQPWRSCWRPPPRQTLATSSSAANAAGPTVRARACVRGGGVRRGRKGPERARCCAASTRRRYMRAHLAPLRRTSRHRRLTLAAPRAASEYAPIDAYPGDVLGAPAHAPDTRARQLSSWPSSSCMVTMTRCMNHAAFGTATLPHRVRSVQVHSGAARRGAAADAGGVRQVRQGRRHRARRPRGGPLPLRHPAAGGAAGRRRHCRRRRAAVQRAGGGHLFFGCPIDDHCAADGQKVQVNVAAPGALGPAPAPGSMP